MADCRNFKRVDRCQSAITSGNAQQAYAGECLFWGLALENTTSDVGYPIIIQDGVGAGSTNIFTIGVAGAQLGIEHMLNRPLLCNDGIYVATGADNLTIFYTPI